MYANLQNYNRMHLYRDYSLVMYNVFLSALLSVYHFEKSIHQII